MATPSRVEDWFQLVPHLVWEEGWEVLIDQPKSGTFFHCDCPWGGELLKIRVEVSVENPPENPAHLLLRPEVRALFGNGTDPNTQMLSLHAPGEALLRQLHGWGLSSYCSSFLEASDDRFRGEFSTWKSSWLRISRDFPEEGDSSLSFDGDSLGVLLARPRVTPGRYEISDIFHVSQEQFEQWDLIHLRLLFEQLSYTARWFVNRPGISDLRNIDEDFYTILTVQSCRRGLPLLPYPKRGEVQEEEVIKIVDGQELGLDRWIRFDAMRYGSDKFYLSQYLQLFLANLNIHHNFPTYNSLDGNQLVSFQCVVRRDAWNMVKEAFNKAFLMQKKAYRRGNGGNSAPALLEDVKPRVVRDRLDRLSEVQAIQQRLSDEQPNLHKVVVRRTFLDVDDPSSPEGPGVTARSSRRSRTTSILQGLRACGA